MARVSIIIPTRNRADLLRRAIESAKQAGTDVEIVVVDDASTDETPAMCQAMTGIVFIRLNRNVGPSEARNVGISESTGEFIAFLDDDDLRVPGSIDKQAEILARNEELGLVYGQVHIGDPERCEPTGEIRPIRCPMGDVFWEFVTGNFIYVPSVMVRKRFLDPVAPFDVVGVEDWDLWLRLTENHPVGALAEPVAVYRDFTRGSRQLSSNRPRTCKLSAYTQGKALLSPRAMRAEPGVRRNVRSDYMNALWENLVLEGKWAAAEANYRYAAANFLMAARLNPRRLLRAGMLVSFVRQSASLLKRKSLSARGYGAGSER